MQFQTLLEKLSWGEVHDAEAHIHQAFRSIGVEVEFTKHFIERINHERNKKDITVKELEAIFAKALKSYGKKIHDMKDHHNAIITDTDTWINIPFVMIKDRSGKLHLKAKTIMRTKMFYPSHGEKKYFV